MQNIFRVRFGDGQSNCGMFECLSFYWPAVECVTQLHLLIVEKFVLNSDWLLCRHKPRPPVNHHWQYNSSGCDHNNSHFLHMSEVVDK
jgi:hypothetical protein